MLKWIDLNRSQRFGAEPGQKRHPKKMIEEERVYPSSYNYLYFILWLFYWVIGPLLLYKYLYDKDKQLPQTARYLADGCNQLSFFLCCFFFGLCGSGIFSVFAGSEIDRRKAYLNQVQTNYTQNVQQNAIPIVEAIPVNPPGQYRSPKENSLNIS